MTIASARHMADIAQSGNQARLPVPGSLPKHRAQSCQEGAHRELDCEVVFVCTAIHLHRRPDADRRYGHMSHQQVLGAPTQAQEHAVLVAHFSEQLQHTQGVQLVRHLLTQAPVSFLGSSQVPSMASRAPCDLFCRKIMSDTTRRLQHSVVLHVSPAAIA